MQQLANASFVIIFLIIIYSQITGGGIGSYNVKTMLPRLLVAAVLVNISFILCQIAVDLSNTFGFALKGFFDDIGGLIKVGDSINDGTLATRALSAVGVVGTILAAVGGLAALLMALSFPVIISGVLALGMIVLILMTRTVLIVILSIVSPIAFVLWIIPNTKQIFSRWGKLYFSLLMLFPMIAVVFGASNFVAKLLQGLSAGDDQVIMSLMALAAASLPLFAVPGMLKGALNATGQLGAKLSGIGSAAAKNFGSKVKTDSRLGQYTDYRKREAATRRALVRAGAYKGRRPVSWAANKLNQGINALTPGRFGDRLSAQGVALVSKEDDQQVEEAATLLRSTMDPDNTREQATAVLMSAQQSGDVVKARAAAKILMGSGAPGLKDLQGAIHTMEANGMDRASGVATALRNDILGSGLKGKDAVLNAWAYNGKTIQQTRDDAGTFSGLNNLELAGQNKDNIAVGAASGGITAAAAAQALNSDSAKDMMSAETRQALSSVAGIVPPAPTAGGGNPNPSGGGGVPSGGGSPNSSP